ncbi:MAG: ATP-dependent zinc protease [Acidimicrobiia bacterium]|nr:ATP-dependent zinc protease [Acidimicrobiia bacterium]
MARRKKTPTPIGWREWIVLPDLCPTPIKVKVDTGARTSALHAFRLRVNDNGGQPYATFEIHPHQRSREDSVRVRADVIGYKRVRSSNGKAERRPVIVTTARMGDREWPIEVTLTRRQEMGYRMLLGRSAMRQAFTVNPGRSFLLGVPSEIEP